MPGFEATAADKFVATIQGVPNYQWQYVLKDHLGNQRVLFTDKNNDGQIRQSTDSEQNEVLSIRNYSPFGLELGGSNQHLSYQNAYKYTGKEENSFTGYYDFGARWADPTVGNRFLQLDELSEKYYAISSYVYVANNPILLKDPDGRDIDVSGFKTKEEQEILRKFLSTKIGYAFFAQFANKGDEVAGIKFDKTGEYAKDLLALKSDAHQNMTLYEGLTQTFERKDPKQGNIYGKELQDADEKTDASKGIIHLIRINANTSNFGKLTALNHEAFVHVQEDVKRLSELRNGKIKPGTEEYINQLKFTGRSATIDHNRLSEGRAIEYKTQAQQLDKIYNTNIYTKFYNYDVKQHKK